MKKTVILTNDDGIFSPALTVLQKKLSHKYNVITVVPDSERSAVSMAITINEPLKLEEIRKDVYTTNGYPSDSVNLAVKHICSEKPDFIISGMNLGENLGVDIFYSGTVAGAFSGHLLGIPSMAVSLMPSDKREYDFEGGAEVTLNLIDKLVEKEFADCVYNVNIPFRNCGEILLTRPGGKKYFTNIVEERDPRGKKILWTGGGSPYYSDDESTDSWAVKNGYISFSTLRYDISDNSMGEPGKKLFG